MASYSRVETVSNGLSVVALLRFCSATEAFVWVECQGSLLGGARWGGAGWSEFPILYSKTPTLYEDLGRAVSASLVGCEP